MARNTLQAVVDGLEVLASGRSKKTNGKITAVNLARESGVSKATLYRLLERRKSIRDDFDALRKNGISLMQDAPETQGEANLILKNEVKGLRSEIAELRREFSQVNKVKAHQIHVLWTENERLKEDFRRLKEFGVAGNVVSISSKNSK